MSQISGLCDLCFKNKGEFVTIFVGNGHYKEIFHCAQCKPNAIWSDTFARIAKMKERVKIRSRR